MMLFMIFAYFRKLCNISFLIYFNIISCDFIRDFLKFIKQKLMLCFNSSLYVHLWHQMSSSLGLYRQSHQYLRVHCILCGLLLEQRVVELVKSYLKREMILGRTSW